MIGALIWGDGGPLRTSLDRADLWDTRRVPEFTGPGYKFRIMKQWHVQGRVDDLVRVYEKPYSRAAPTKIPAGRIELDFPAAERFAECRLSLENAVATVSFTGGGSLEAFVHATEPVGLARVRAGTGAPEVAVSRAGQRRVF